MVEEEKSRNIRVVAENNDFLAFTFFAARFPFEIWILPKKHQLSFETIPAGERENMARVIYEVLGMLNKTLRFPPFNWWIHTSPRQDHVGNFYHWHMEIAPRVSKFGGYEMGSGIVIDVVSPELAAQFLKKVS
ncbi:MAG: galactose-1-phosphate uridyl transferase, Gal-1-P uridylyltransferase [Candidatus Berkelbacteria bacterium]|nr:galactose-1-phosphate uridyl transferase, Gal-1-P uridylyltransferase [Candidatus Berkelbacteria bacterium]